MLTIIAILLGSIVVSAAMRGLDLVMNHRLVPTRGSALGFNRD